jgi:hypothetical protein
MGRNLAETIDKILSKCGDGAFENLLEPDLHVLSLSGQLRQSKSGISMN